MNLQKIRHNSHIKSLKNVAGNQKNLYFPIALLRRIRYNTTVLVCSLKRYVRYVRFECIMNAVLCSN